MAKNAKKIGSGSNYFYDIIISTGNFLQDFILLIFRVYWGYGFLVSGWHKIMSQADSVAYFSSINIPYPEFFVFLVAAVEFLGGICLLLGLASRLIAIPLIITMIIALHTAHDISLLDVLNQEKFTIQAPVTFLMASIVIFVFGPGRISLDYLFERYYFRRAN